MTKEETVKDVMTSDPVTLEASKSVKEAADLMRKKDIGDVVVLESNGELCGIVTDRDIVVRAVAKGDDPAKKVLGDICSKDVMTVKPDTPINEAVTIMRGKAIRRIPVVKNGTPVGIVSIGDLAVDRDPKSALADISAAPANT
jgi:CBS domain-containing protein